MICENRQYAFTSMSRPYKLKVSFFMVSYVFPLTRHDSCHSVTTCYTPDVSAKVHMHVHTLWYCILLYCTTGNNSEIMHKKTHN